MQMNQALFMAGGHCGYVLQPSTMRDEAFDPFDKSSLRGLEPCAICIEVGVGSASSASWWEGAAPG
jgi:phosphatidylinositol phospholipase C gamma-1